MTHRETKNQPGRPSVEEKIFDQARKLYPGVKRGNETEFANFTKKHKRWREILPLLLPAIQAQIEWMDVPKGVFRPGWKHFATWINQSFWEFSPVTKQKTIKRCYACKKVSETKPGIVALKTCKVPLCENCRKV